MIRFQKFAQEKYTKSRTYQDSALQYQGKKAHTVQGWDESPKDFKYQKNIMMSLNMSKNIGFEINTRISNTHNSFLIGSNINQNLKNANVNYRPTSTVVFT